MEAVKQEHLDTYLDRLQIPVSKFQEDHLDHLFPISGTSENIPDDVGKRTVFSRDLADWFGPNKECLLWVYDYSIFPNLELPGIFEAYRGGLSNPITIESHPGTLILAEESHHLVNLIALGVYFFWDFYVLSEPKNRLAFVSHDGYCKRWNLISEIV